MTKEAGRECLMRVVERLARKSGAPAPVSSSPPTSTTASLTTGQAPLTATAAAPEREHAETQLDLDLLFERSNKLRGTVATARSTTFGQDS